MVQAYLNLAFTGIIALDPPFTPKPEHGHCSASEYRDFLGRPSMRAQYQNRQAGLSFRGAIRYYLERRLSNPSLRFTAIQDAFWLLGDVYRVIASEWIVVNEYLSRELVTIEYRLEKEEPNIQDLELHLRDLFIMRRRSLRYLELVSNAHTHCQQRGRQSWPKVYHSSGLVREDAQGLEEDYQHVQRKFQATCLRIDKHINLLTTLVAIRENKQGIRNNQGLSRLTLLATFCLPFGTVATILSMEDRFAPGQDRFWLYWVVAVPLTALLVTASLVPYKWWDLRRLVK